MATLGHTRRAFLRRAAALAASSRGLRPAQGGSHLRSGPRDHHRRERAAVLGLRRHGRRRRRRPRHRLEPHRPRRRGWSSSTRPPSRSRTRGASSGPAALEDSDFTARVDLVGPAGGPAHLLPRRRSRTCRPAGVERAGRRHASRRRRAGAARRDASPGRPTRWARAGASTPSWAACSIYETMRRREPDVFIHIGDTIYADSRSLAEVKLDDGTRVAEPRDSGQGQGGRDARRVPRQLPLQPARRAHAALQRRGAAARACGTTTRCATTGIRRAGPDRTTTATR